MRQDPLDGDRTQLRELLLKVEPLKMLPHRVSETDQPLVAELHHADAGEELRDRADRVHRARRGRHLLINVCVSEPLRVDQFLVVNHSQGRTRDALVVPLRLHPGLE